MKQILRNAKQTYSEWKNWLICLEKSGTFNRGGDFLKKISYRRQEAFNVYYIFEVI